MSNKATRNFIMTTLRCGMTIIMLSFAAFAQTPTTPTTTTRVRRGVVNTHPIPLNHVYWHFFIYQEHLEKVAVEHEKQGKDGRWLRDHFETALGFNDGDFNSVRVAALYVSQGIAKLNQREQAIIDSDRAAMKAHPFPPGVPPPGIPQLKLITVDRETLLNTQIEQMNLALGPVKAQILKSYLMQTVQNGPKSPASTVATTPAEVKK